MINKILLSKELIKNPIFRDGDCLRLFLHFLTNAAMYIEQDIQIRGEYIDLTHGQSVYTFSSLSEEIELSIQKIRSRIVKLIDAGLVIKKSYKQFFIIEISEFDQYLQEHEKQATLLKQYYEENNDE